MQAERTGEAGRPGTTSATVQPEIKDLKQVVRLALRQRKRRSAGRWPEPLLFLAPQTPPLPAALIGDTALAPMDKLIWLILRKRLEEASEEPTLPSHRALARTTGIVTRRSVATSLAMLRCRRYLSVCASAWHGGDKKVGKAYALHARPLPITDALFLDPGYGSYVNDLLAHPVTRVQKAARKELAMLPTEPVNAY